MARRQKKEQGSFAVFLVQLILLVLVIRSFVFTSFSIPSESMMPRLLEGDYLFAAKWPYGYSQASLPLDIKLFDGRIPAGIPDRGDVVIFKHPIDRSDYIKRVIGLPGDQIQVTGGALRINGEAVARNKVEDLEIAVRPNEGCAEASFTVRAEDGSFTCKYPQFREVLPNGVSYRILDLGPSPQDNTQAVVVPEGMLFMMGDNRDNSLDSRFPAEVGRGVGFVPVENVVARASLMFFSTDGTAEWIKPWTWFTAARWGRMGQFI